MVQLPRRLPAARWLFIIWSLYGLIWISLEGDLRRVLVMGAGAAIVLVGQGLQRWGWKRPFTLPVFLLLNTLLGLLAGAFAGPLSLFFMVLKTGLHAHGPEFTAAEINWVLQHIPFWGISGALGGLGIGLLLASRYTAASDP